MHLEAQHRVETRSAASLCYAAFSTKMAGTHLWLVSQFKGLVIVGLPGEALPHSHSCLPRQKHGLHQQTP